MSAVGKEKALQRQQEEITALYCRLSQDDGREGRYDANADDEDDMLQKLKLVDLAQHCLYPAFVYVILLHGTF